MQSSQPEKRIFGVRIDDISLQDAQVRILTALEMRTGFAVSTLNPEIMLYARTHRVYRELLNAHTLNSVDGFGLQKLGGFLHRVTGADLAESVLRRATEERFRVACIVRPNGLSSPEEIQQTIEKRFPGIMLRVYTFLEDDSAFDGELIGFDPEIVLVGLGFPTQETWVMNRGVQLLPMSVFLSIGGTFDYWTGVQPRAPKIVQRFGFEWFWRLCMQPKRIVRIFRAVIVFPLIFFIFHRKNR